MVIQGHTCERTDYKKGLRQGNTAKAFLLVFRNVRAPPHANYKKWASSQTNEKNIRVVLKLYIAVSGNGKGFEKIKKKSVRSYERQFEWKIQLK